MADRVDRVGQCFGDYRLTRWLGGGSFGDVYLGEHIHVKTLAAVKVLQTRLTDKEDLKDFRIVERKKKIGTLGQCSLTEKGFSPGHSAGFLTLAVRHVWLEPLPLDM